MKILLFGEFSGLFNSLKDGLLKLGHEVFLASDGNSYRNYPSDFRWDAYTKDKLGKFKGIFCGANIWAHKHMFKGYDVVMLISPSNVSRFWNKKIYEYLIDNNKLVYQSGCGDTCLCFDYWYNSNTKYHEYYKGYFLDTPNPVTYNNPKVRAWEESLLEKITGYIPIWYEYAEPYRNYSNCKPTIRIPIAVDKFQYQTNQLIDGKIVFYHGITRACKGTRFILPAFERLKKSFSDKAVFIAANKLPFDEYMKVINSANVIIDDANSYSVAMNGLFSMAKGKIVMGGAEDIANKELGLKYNPVINLQPDVDQICDSIVDLINRRDEVEEMGQLSRKFVEEYHDSVEIAKQYIDIWTKDLNQM